MADPWNEPPPLIDENFKSRMIARTTDYLSQVNWKSNCIPTSLDDAVAQAKKGNDGGYELTMTLRPQSMDFHQWMQWSALVTFLYNRDTPVARILSAIRTVCQLQCI